MSEIAGETFDSFQFIKTIFNHKGTKIFFSSLCLCGSVFVVLLIFRAELSLQSVTYYCGNVLSKRWTANLATLKSRAGVGIVKNLLRYGIRQVALHLVHGALEERSVFLPFLAFILLYHIWRDYLWG